MAQSQIDQHKATRRERGGNEAFHDVLVWLEGHADWLTLVPTSMQSHPNANLRVSPASFY
jgi:hypothetical protein